jgi:hypothetical protein
MRMLALVLAPLYFLAVNEHLKTSCRGQHAFGGREVIVKGAETIDAIAEISRKTDIKKEEEIAERLRYSISNLVTRNGQRAWLVPHIPR